MKVYVAEYTSCIYESDYSIVSLHFKEIDAYEAAYKKLKEEKNLFYEHIEFMLKHGFKVIDEEFPDYIRIRIKEYEVK